MALGMIHNAGDPDCFAPKLDARLRWLLLAALLLLLPHGAVVSAGRLVAMGGGNSPGESFLLALGLKPDKFEVTIGNPSETLTVDFSSDSGDNFGESSGDWGGGGNGIDSGSEGFAVDGQQQE